MQVSSCSLKSLMPAFAHFAGSEAEPGHEPKQPRRQRWFQQRSWGTDSRHILPPQECRGTGLLRDKQRHPAHSMLPAGDISHVSRGTERCEHVHGCSQHLCAGSSRRLACSHHRSTQHLFLVSFFTPSPGTVSMLSSSST